MGRPALVKTEWLPCVAWFVEDDTRHTRLNFSPIYFERRRDRCFQLKVSLFDGTNSEARFVTTSGIVSGTSTACLEGRALLETAGLNRFDGIVEMCVFDPESPPEHTRYHVSWVQYYSDDHSLEGYVPANPIMGATKKARTGGHSYQHFPGIVVDDRTRATTVVINPYTRAARVAYLFYVAGKAFESAPVRLRPKAAHVVDLATLFPRVWDEYRHRPNTLGSVVIRAPFKLLAFAGMGIRNGPACAFDHSHPFIEF